MVNFICSHDLIIFISVNFYQKQKLNILTCPTAQQSDGLAVIKLYGKFFFCGGRCVAMSGTKIDLAAKMAIWAGQLIFDDTEQ